MNPAAGPGHFLWEGDKSERSDAKEKRSLPPRGRGPSDGPSVSTLPKRVPKIEKGKTA